MLVAATPPDSAVIVNSGSTNTSGYAIQVSSEGKASVTIQNRGTASSTPKPFTVNGLSLVARVMARVISG